jgi:UDP-N-acetylglucosamine transferase subunit ALG13
VILVTVGTQLGFDRLISAMDNLANTLEVPIIAQIGAGRYKPKNMTSSSSFDPEEFETLIRSSKLIVSHAGTGTILNATKHCKPIVILPRRAEFSEHRNNHQVATARFMSNRPGVFVATQETELLEQIRQALAADLSKNAPSDERNRIVNELKGFLAKHVVETPR